MPSPTKSRRTPPAKPHVERKRILIVEDEAALLALLADTFGEEHFAVFTAKSGREGLRVAFRERPDLIILDLLMPDMDGLAMLAALRRDRYKWGKYVPVIILSNLSNPETVAAGMRQADDYLIKADWSMADLVRKVKEKLAAGATSRVHP
ncbi:response regulator [Candidatus Parcubacteria bacterium]|nr:MAG: response regulator [Candidatus Parcubacteria bacterium]